MKKSKNRSRELSETRRVEIMLNQIPLWIKKIICNYNREDQVINAAMINSSLFEIYVSSLVDKYLNPNKKLILSDVIEKEYSLKVSDYVETKGSEIQDSNKNLLN